MGGPQTKRNPDAEARARQQTAFVIAETVNLLHHVSETLLRYYLAHAPDKKNTVSPCPWLDIARELSHVEVKKKIAARFDGSSLTDTRRRELSSVFYDSPSPPTSDDVQATRLRASVENIEQWLQHFAKVFLDDAHLYNSLKHWLAVQPGDSMIKLVTPMDEERAADPPLIHAEGPAVLFLERAGDENLWHRTTRWVQPERLILESQYATWLLSSIWKVGRMRYTMRSPEGEPLRFFDEPTYEKYMNTQLGTDGWAIITDRMSVNLTYMYAYPPDLICSDCKRVPREDERGTARKTWRGREDGPGSLAVICPECVATAQAR